MIALDWLDSINFDDDGLIPAISQDHLTGKVLMMAWMNAESLMETVSTKRAVYWSRSRQRLWRKGEESGHHQSIKAIHLDCDADVILLTVEQHGDIACHTGRNSCFYQRLNIDSKQPTWETSEPVLKDPSTIYSR